MTSRPRLDRSARDEVRLPLPSPQKFGDRCDRSPGSLPVPVGISARVEVHCLLVRQGLADCIMSGAGGNGFNVFQSAAPAYSAFRESSYGEFVKVTVSPTALVVNAVRADTNAVFDRDTGQYNSRHRRSDGSVRFDGRSTGSTSVPLSWSAATEMSASPDTRCTGTRGRHWSDGDRDRRRPTG